MLTARDQSGMAGGLQRWSDSLVLLWGWRRAAVAIAAGALSALAQAPLHLFPVLWITLPVLVFLIDGAVDGSPAGGIRRYRPAFAVGWWFGTGYFLAGLWWIGAAFTVDLARFGWMIPFALLGLAGGLGLFMGLGTAIARLFWTTGPARILALAVGLGTSEYLRGHVLTGFPWNALGYGLAATDPLMQVASLVGLEGMTILAVLVFAAPAALLGGGRAARAAGLAALALLGAIWGYGAWRLHQAGPATAAVDQVRLRIMQPNVDQWRKWKPEFRQEIMDTYLALSRGADGKGLDGVTHLIWPESAFPFFIAQEAWALTALADLLPPATTLITGAIRAEAPSAGEARPRVYNSIVVIGEDAEILAAADKVHLVPFGEYLPWQETMEAIGLRQLTHLRGGFTAGPGLAGLDVPGAPRVGPLICYEAIFPGAVIDDADRPGWLLNVTNDGWFGATPGPWQHLHQARLRAVEEGLPMVRAANTGISAVVDGYGRVVKSLPLGVSGVLDADLPVALDRTLYASTRYSTPCLLVLGMLCLGFMRKADKKP